MIKKRKYNGIAKFKSVGELDDSSLENWLNETLELASTNKIVTSLLYP